MGDFTQVRVEGIPEQGVWLVTITPIDGTPYGGMTTRAFRSREAAVDALTDFFEEWAGTYKVLIRNVLYAE